MTESSIWSAQGSGPLCILPAMNAPSKPVPHKDERSERLAAALRENLKRRKAQARGQARAKEKADKSADPG